MKLFKRPVLLNGALEGFAPIALWRHHIFSQWPIYSLGIFTVILTNVTEVAIPKLMQLTIDTISGEKTEKSFEFYFWILLVVFIFQFIGRFGWRITLAQQSHRTGSRMKSLLWDRAKFLPRHRLDTDLSPGELMNVATGDVGTSRFAFGFTLVGTTDLIFLLGLSSLAMFSIDWKLTLWILCLYPILPFFLHRLARKEGFNHKEAQESLSALTDLASQTVSTVRLQRITQTGSFWRKKLQSYAENYRQKRFQVIKTGLAFIPIAGIAPIISFIILFYLGLQKVETGELSIGAFVAFQSYILLIQNPLFELGIIISEWQKGFTSLRRVTHIYQQSEAENLRSGGQNIIPSNEILSVKNLKFKYPNTNKYILTNFSLSLKQGERLGIKGPIGAGKSTLVQILSGFERHFEGDVSLFDKNILSYSHESLRQIIGMVPQKIFLFADTVRNNIKLHNYDVSDQELWRILDICCLKKDIEELPHKLDTKLGEWGINLSGGQKQRMTLARSLAAKPKILFLDDCLSAVDTVTEEKILQNLDLELKETTLIWVAHRSSTLKYCTKVIEMSAS